jgi:catechol 2,3-dioxygenase-like lactoylglutathione lyase family enzyme
MTKTIPAKIKITELNQVGLIVRDIEKTVKDYWNILGIGPHIIVTVEPVEGYSMNYRGKPAKFKFKASFCRVGSLELELLQSLDGRTIYDDYLREHGEGAHHLQSLAKSVADIQKQVEIFSGEGFPLLMGGHFGSEVGFAYIDTYSALKTTWETVRMPDNPSGVPEIYPSDPSEPSPAKIKVKEISRIGIVVKNLEEVMNNYGNISDIGPWDISELKYPALYDVTYRGRIVSPEWKIASASAGSVQLELIQPISGENIYSDFISKQGEGIHHIQFLVDDIDETNRIMEAEGFSVLMGGRILDGGFAFYDTSGPLKVIWEALQLPKTGFPEKRFV